MSVRVSVAGGEAAAAKPLGLGLDDQGVRTFTGIENVMCAASGDLRLHRSNIEMFISHDDVIWQSRYALEVSI